jgi:serine/threonine-protein kinase
MDPQRGQRLRQIFEQALELDPARRSEFLRQVCGADIELLAEVEGLLTADQRTHSLIGRPVLQWEEAEAPCDWPFQQIGPYRIAGKLGEGGMGEVYKGVRQNPQMTVAIKLMQPDLPREEAQRFEDEQQILADLNHPNIVRLFDSGEIAGRRYFVMEFVEGKSLKEMLDNGPLPLAQVVEITGQVCSAIGAAHRRGIVHRDLKPFNLMVAERDGELVVKALDFGIAALKDSGELTKRNNTQGVIGTPAYLSPEQAAGKRRDQIDGRADIYSLGAVVYEMITGQKLFNGNWQELVHQHLAVKPIAPSIRRPDLNIPKAVDEAVLRALEKNPNKRYSTAPEFAQSLANAIATKPPEKRWMKYALPAAAALLLALGGWLGYERLSQRGANQNGATTQSQPPAEQPKTQSGVTAGATEANGASTTASPAAPNGAVERPRLDVTVYRIAENGARTISSDFTFRSGDAMGFALIPPQSGYLYLLQQGSKGNVEIIYPDRRLEGSFQRVEAGRNVKAPAQRDLGFKLDNNPGTETVYVILAPTKDDPLIRELDAMIAQGRSLLSPDQGKSALEKLNTYANGTGSADTSQPQLIVKIVRLNHLADKRPKGAETQLSATQISLPFPPRTDNAAPGGAAPSSAYWRLVKEENMTIQANLAWTDTSINVEAGQEVRIIASTSRPVDLGALGYSGVEGVSLTDDSKPKRDCSTGAVIAKIGGASGEEVCVKRDALFTARRPGQVFVGLNESDHEDNNGSFNVKIRVFTFR